MFHFLGAAKNDGIFSPALAGAAALAEAAALATGLPATDLAGAAATAVATFLLDDGRPNAPANAVAAEGVVGRMEATEALAFAAGAAEADFFAGAAATFFPGALNAAGTAGLSFFSMPKNDDAVMGPERSPFLILKKACTERSAICRDPCRPHRAEGTNAAATARRARKNTAERANMIWMWRGQ